MHNRIIHENNDENLFSMFDQFINNSEVKHIEEKIEYLIKYLPMELIVEYIVKTSEEKKLKNIIKKLSEENLIFFCNQKQKNQTNGYLFKSMIFYRNPKFIFEVFGIVKNRNPKLFEDIFIHNDSYLNNPLIRIFNQYKYSEKIFKQDSKKYLIKLLKLLDEKTLNKVCEKEPKLNVMLHILRSAFYDYAFYDDESDDFPFQVIKHLPESSQIILCKKDIICYSNLLLLAADLGSMPTIKKLFNLQKKRKDIIELLTMKGYSTFNFFQLMIESRSAEKIAFIIDELRKMKASIFISFFCLPHKSQNRLMYVLENIQQYDGSFKKLFDKINKILEKINECSTIQKNKLKDIKQRNKFIIEEFKNYFFQYNQLKKENKKLKNKLNELNICIKKNNGFFKTNENIIEAVAYGEKLSTLNNKMLKQNKEKILRKKHLDCSIKFYGLNENIENLKKSCRFLYNEHSRSVAEYKLLKDKIEKLLNPFEYNKKNEKKFKLISHFLFLFLFHGKFQQLFQEYIILRKKLNRLFVKCYPDFNENNENNEKIFSNKKLTNIFFVKENRPVSKLGIYIKLLNWKRLECIKEKKYFNECKKKISALLISNKKSFKNNYPPPNVQVLYNCFDLWYGENSVSVKKKIDILDQIKLLHCLVQIQYGERCVDDYIKILRQRMKIQDDISMTEKKIVALKKEKEDLDMKTNENILSIYNLFCLYPKKPIQNDASQVKHQNRVC